jgi:hypothetical protein
MRIHVASAGHGTEQRNELAPFHVIGLHLLPLTEKHGTV